MWLVYMVAILSAALIAVCLVSQRASFREATRGWQMLGASGVPMALGGLGFVVRFWEPLSGPYLANERYPLGPYLNAWAVSFGFMWIAFGLVFFALAVRARPSRWLWFSLLVAWGLAWLPHGIIGIGFATAGSNHASLQLYRVWASDWLGALQLVASAVVVHLGWGHGPSTAAPMDFERLLVEHAGFSVAAVILASGFTLTAYAARRPRHEDEQPR